jgi:hypothetical protein
MTLFEETKSHGPPMPSLATKKLEKFYQFTAAVCRSRLGIGPDSDFIKHWDCSALTGSFQECIHAFA